MASAKQDSPAAVAARHRASLQKSAEKGAELMAPSCIGEAALALAAAGTPVTNEALIAKLLSVAQRDALLAPACRLAARALGWPGLA